MHTKSELMSETAQGVAADYYGSLDPIATEVVSDQTQNLQYGHRMSNRDMCNRVMALLEWEDVDLFAPLDFEAVYKRAQANEVLAYSLLAFLRMRVFMVANERDIGISRLNERLVEHSKVWNTKLSELWNALRSGVPSDKVRHRWNN